MPQYHVGESENGAYFHFIICFPVFLMKWWIWGKYMYDPCLESLICSYCEQTYFDLLQKGALLEENHDASPKTFQIFPGIPILLEMFMSLYDLKRPDSISAAWRKSSFDGLQCGICTPNYPDMLIQDIFLIAIQYVNRKTHFFVVPTCPGGSYEIYKTCQGIGPWISYLGCKKKLFESSISVGFLRKSGMSNGIIMMIIIIIISLFNDILYIIYI